MNKDLAGRKVGFVEEPADSLSLGSHMGSSRGFDDSMDKLEDFDADKLQRAKTSASKFDTINVPADS